MSVRRQRRLFAREYALVCDGCGRARNGFPALAAAIDFAAKAGWKTAREGGRYRDLCPACAWKERVSAI